MDREKPSWAVIVAFSLASACLVMLLVALVHRYLFDEGFRWGESAGTAVGPFIAWTVLGGRLRAGKWPFGRQRRDGR